MTEHPRERVLKALAMLPPDTWQDLIEKLPWIAKGWPMVFRDEKTLQCVEILNAAANVVVRT